MSNILIIDPSPLCQELLPLALQSCGHKVISCLPANAGVQIEKNAPALVILEVGATGIGVLKGLRGQEQHRDLPILILTDNSSRESIVQAARMGIRDYMLKQHFTRSELLSRVRKHLASPATPGTEAGHLPAPATPGNPTVAPQAPVGSPDTLQDIRDAAQVSGIPLLTREDMLSRIEKAQVKTLPGAVAELMSLVSSSRCTIDDVAQALKKDPILSARVLRVANSTAFASNRLRIPNIQEAVKHVGLATVRKLISSVGVFETFASGQGGESILRSWQHSLAVASLMEKLAVESEDAPAGVAYMVGLCHDLGDIILRQYFCREYTHVVELARQTGRPQRQVEAVVFGLPYSELISMLLARLGLPGAVRAPIQELFERAGHKPQPGAGSVLGRALRIANLYAHGLLLAPGLDDPVLPLSKDECRQSFGKDIPALDVDAIRGEALTNTGVLAGLSSAETAAACEPLVARQPVHVDYFRHHEYDAMDPLHTLLQLTTQKVALLQRMPDAFSNGAQAKALIVVASRSADLAELRQLMGRLGDLTRACPTPTLLLMGMEPHLLGSLPPAVAAERLPVSIQRVGEFLKRAAGESVTRAA